MSPVPAALDEVLPSCLKQRCQESRCAQGRNRGQIHAASPNYGGVWLCASLCRCTSTRQHGTA